MQNATAPRATSFQGAGQITGLSRSTLYKLAAAGSIRTIKVGARRLVMLDSLDALLSGKEG